MHRSLTGWLAIASVPVLFAIAVLAAYAWGPGVQAVAASAPAAAADLATGDAGPAHEVSVPALQHVAASYDAATVADLPVLQGEVAYAPFAAPPVARDYRAHVQVVDQERLGGRLGQLFQRLIEVRHRHH
ncbi:MAG: hypothetical protein P1P87_13545, partial [Trueperaceae bacterium]|nr:hypothetical protein [Trueperaceae bacterium]